MKAIGKVGKVQLVFPKHSYGQLALENAVDPQPPLGLLTLASYVREKLPDINVEIFDGKKLNGAEISGMLDAEIIGLSVWYSNYENAKKLAEQIKTKNPNTTVIMGGPHATAIADRITQQNHHVDVVVIGEGEFAFTQLLKGVAWKEIPGIIYRSDEYVSRNWDEKKTYIQIDLDSLPLFDLELLNPPFQWKRMTNPPAMSAFPLAGIRGCCRNTRCEYCSGHFNGFRSMNPEKYWEQVELLNGKYNIDYFFETGDIFPPKLLRQFSCFKNKIEVGFRVYSYLGYLKNKDMEYLRKFGVRTVFMGIESVLVWKGKFIRKYPANYNIESLFNEIDMLRWHGIDVVTSFILGLPGETIDSLSGNIRIIRDLLKCANVKEITVSVVLPIPGSIYFMNCLNDSYIKQKYGKITGNDLLYCDTIDYYLLSQIFVNRFTNVGYSKIYDSIISLREEIGARMAHFGSIEPLENKLKDIVFPIIG